MTVAPRAALFHFNAFVVDAPGAEIALDEVGDGAVLDEGSENLGLHAQIGCNGTVVLQERRVLRVEEIAYHCAADRVVVGLDSSGSTEQRTAVLQRGQCNRKHQNESNEQNDSSIRPVRLLLLSSRVGLGLIQFILSPIQSGSVTFSHFLFPPFYVFEIRGMRHLAA